MSTILVALDGSSRAPGVLAQAVAAARAQKGQLVLVQTVGIPADLPQDLWKASDQPLLDVLKQRAAEYLARCEISVPSELRGGARVVVGAPWQAICEAARSVQAELLVIGSHGYSGVDHLLGTTAAKVVNHAPCSVLVVREAVSR
jgi:nucleotide-binding universal stress UspA family protein